MRTILTTYANSRGAGFLEELGKEDDAVTQLLKQGMLAGHYVHFPDSFVTREKLTYNLRLLRSSLFLFSYSGHAGSEKLFLEDQVVRGEGVLGLLKACPHLQVVILNGCGTYAQARALHEAGIPYVIGTSRPVGDDAARRFASVLTEQLMAGATIEDAFEEGMREIEVTQSLDVVRKVGTEEEYEEEVPVWCMLKKADAVAVRLPQKAAAEVVTDYVPNKLLLKALFQNEELKSQKLTELREKIVRRERVSPADRRIAVINCLPAPLAVHLQKLMIKSDKEEDESYNKPNYLRLRQFVRLYETTMELMIFTLVAQVYETLMAHSEVQRAVDDYGEVSVSYDQRLHLSETLSKEIYDYLTIQEEDRPIYPYIHLIRQLRLWLEERKDGFFVEELAQLADIFGSEENDFAAACAHMEGLRLQFRLSPEPILPIVAACQAAEENMVTLIGALGFLSRYTLATVKSINIQKYKHQHKASFVHQLVRLRDLVGGLDEMPYRFNQFMDNRSVLLLKENNGKYHHGQLPAFLNLSPFVVDRSSFQAMEGEISQVHFYRTYDEKTGQLLFQFVPRPADPTWDIDLPDVPEDEDEALAAHPESFIHEQFTHFLRMLKSPEAVAV